jgi:hypothetical protein
MQPKRQSLVAVVLIHHALLSLYSVYNTLLPHVKQIVHFADIDPRYPAMYNWWRDMRRQQERRACGVLGNVANVRRPDRTKMY